MTTTARRTLPWLQTLGWSTWVVEKWIQFPPPGHRVDVWGFGDILAVHPDISGALLVQTCAQSGYSKHLTKIQGIPEAELWVKSGNHLWVVAWRRLKRKLKSGEWSQRGYWTPNPFRLVPSPQDTLIPVAIGTERAPVFAEALDEQ